MPNIKPFPGYVVTNSRAAEVVSPVYDAVAPAVRRQFAQKNPSNYLNTMKLLEDYPADAQPSTAQLLASNRANLQKLLQSDAFVYSDTPCMFVYRMEAGGHVQTGLVCEVSVDEYADGRIRKHENTRSDKEDLLAMYQKVVGVASSPICLAHPPRLEISTALENIAATAAELSFVSTDGIAQRLWRGQDPAQQAELQSLFAQLDATYLTDGHHRAASGWRYAQMMRQQQNTGETAADATYNQLLVALFSTEQLALLPFHRSVKDLNGLSESAFLGALEKDFGLEKLNQTTPFEPTTHGEFGMHLGGQWYKLRCNPELLGGEDPVRSLDVSLLQDRILAPILGLTCARTDPRLDYISAVHGSDALRQQCAAAAVCFTCAATSMAQLIAVADAGALMPPKSTNFYPKANSGVFVRLK